MSLPARLLVVCCLLTSMMTTRAQDVYVVQPAAERSMGTCPDQSCLTLNQLAQHHFTPGSTFVFLAGNHTSPATVNITNTSNITLVSETNLACISGVTILCDSVTNLTFQGLTFILDSDSILEPSSAIHLFNCRSTLISNRFQGSGNLKKTLARGISSLFSALNIVSCYFEGNTGDYGGAIYARAGSIVNLTGNTFIGNRVKLSGGAVFAEDSTITLKEKLGNTFNNNSGRSSGGALYCKNSRLYLEPHSPSISHPLEATAMYNKAAPMPGVQYFESNSGGKYGGAVYVFNSLSFLIGTSVVFRNNSAYRGGGIFMYGNEHRTVVITEINHLLFTGNRATESGGAIYAAQSDLTLRNGHCSFSKNSAGLQGGAIYSESGQTTIMNTSTFEDNQIFATSSSAGAILIFRGNIVLTGTAKFENNKAEVGGAITLYNSIGSISGTEIIFKNNSATIDGGGIYVAYSELTIISASFIGNLAQNRQGGGIAIRDTTKPINISARFSGNRADRGGAVFIVSGTRITINGATIYDNMNSAICVINSNITFSAVTKIVNNTSGGIYAINSYISFRESTIFKNNHALDGGAVNSLYGAMMFSGITIFTQNTAERNGGAIYAIGTDIKFEDTVNATGNLAQNGGAMYFKNIASLTLSESAILTTSHNHAARFGGVIYHEDIPIPVQCKFHGKYEFEKVMVLPRCFLQIKGIDEFNSFYDSPIFKSYEDSANNSSNFLYGGMLDRCKMLDIYSPLLTYNFMIEKLLYTEPHNTSQSTITSDPYQLCFCKNNQSIRSMNIEVHKGETFTASLLATAQGGSASSTSVSVKTSPTARLKLHQSLQILNEYCTSLDFNVYSTNKHELVVLYPSGPCRDIGLARAIINITFLPCPNGFSEHNELCICEKRLREFAVNCTIDDDIFIVKEPGTVLWVSGLYNENGSYHGLVLSSKCPEEYCKTESVSLQLDNPDILCAYNRIGILCGACATNYSLMLGSSRCGKCSNTYLALLLPFAAAGIALVAFLSLLRLTVATGIANSIILYANIVQVTKKLLLPIHKVNIFTVFIAWMNLDLGFDTCFYDGMTAYAQTWLQFAFPIYVWMLICLIILISRHSIKVSKLLGHNPIAVLATLLLMSYTKVLRIITDVFSFVRLDCPDNIRVLVWRKDANVPYMKAEHLFLTVVTSLVLLFLFLPYTVLLLVGYKLYRFSDRKGFKWINRIKPLLDSYYAPYNKKTRYWTGFLLLIRCALYLVLLFHSPKISSLTLVITFTTLVLLGWILIWVYEKLHIIVIEFSVYINIIVLSAATLTRANSPGLVYSLIGIVFVTMVGIIVYNFHLHYTAKFKLWSRVKNFFPWASASTTVTDEVAIGTSQSAPKLISTTVIELREPLLDN